MPLRIACDLDGTLADMDTALQEEAERLFGHGVELRADGPVAIPVALRPPPAADAAGRPMPDPGPSEPRRPLTGSEMRRLWAHVRQIEDFWLSLPEIEPGAVARIATLTAAQRWEVLFITQRPATAGETAQRQSQRWLHAHGFEHPAVYVVNGSRGRVAASLALDVLVDDRPEHCVDVKAESPARPLLVWRGRPHMVPPVVARLGIDVVFSMSAALDELEALTRHRLRPRGFIARMREAMGT